MEEEEIEPVIFSMPKFPRKRKRRNNNNNNNNILFDKEEVATTVWNTIKNTVVLYIHTAKNIRTKVLYRINVSGNRWRR